ncbi:hypothetical protein ACJX0J_032480, partial [Zea mays]
MYKDAERAMFLYNNSSPQDLNLSKPGHEVYQIHLTEVANYLFVFLALYMLNIIYHIIACKDLKTIKTLYQRHNCFFRKKYF